MRTQSSARLGDSGTNRFLFLSCTHGFVQHHILVSSLFLRYSSIHPFVHLPAWEHDGTLTPAAAIALVSILNLASTALRGSRAHYHHTTIALLLHCYCTYRRIEHE